MENPLAWLPLLGVCLMRPLGALSLLPLLSSATVGGSLIRNALVLAIALPMVWAQQNVTLPTGFDLLALLAVEAAIGLVIGFCAALPFWAVDMAGFIIDTMRGASMANLLNPALGSQSAVIGVLFSQMLGVLFLIGGGFNQFLLALYQSYRFLPPGAGWSAAASLPAFLLAQWPLLFHLGLAFAMPAMVIMLLIDIALGFVNRSAQQLNVFFVSMPIKSVLGLLMLLLVLSFAFAPLLDRMRGFAAVMRPLWAAG